MHLPPLCQLPPPPAKGERWLIDCVVKNMHLYTPPSICLVLGKACGVCDSVPRVVCTCMMCMVWRTRGEVWCGLAWSRVEVAHGVASSGIETGHGASPRRGVKTRPLKCQGVGA